MCTSRDETSPSGPPPGPALRPLSSSTNDPPISPLPLASRVPCRPNQIFSTRRGAVSGKHMAQMPTAKQLFASRWAQEDSREIECLEPATWCLWCFPHGGTGSDLSDSAMALHQVPSHNPARVLSFGDFAGYKINQNPPTALEGDTMIDPENHQSDPVSPKTAVTSTGILSSRLAVSCEPYRSTVRPPPSQVDVYGLPPSTRHLRSHTTADEGAYLLGHTGNLVSRPRFAAQTTIDRSHTHDPVRDSPNGESRELVYRFTQEELNARTARAWARSVDRNAANDERKASVLDLPRLSLRIRNNDANYPEHSQCNFSRSQSNDGNTLQRPQIRNLLSTSSSLPILGESTSSSSATSRARDSSGTIGTSIGGTRDSSGSYMPSSPPINVGPAKQWHRTSYDRTAEGQYYQSSIFDPSASVWHRESETEGLQGQQQQKQPQPATGPSPARVTDIFSVRPLATRRPFEPARYVDGGPHSHLASYPLVRPEGSLAASVTAPNLGGYGGMRIHRPRSTTDLAADDNKNTCLWLEGLPSNITYHELLSSISNCGRIYSTYINPPIAHHQTSAAKLAFFTRAGAERLCHQATREEFTVRNQRVLVRWNRNAYTENPRHGSSATRILLIRGPKKWVNETTLTSYFTSLFWSNICSISTIPLDVAAGWAGSGWLENEEEAQLSLPEKFREFAAMRWEFASFHSQASSAKTAIESETAFGGLIKVNFLPDPCDYTGSG